MPRHRSPVDPPGNASGDDAPDDAALFRDAVGPVRQLQAEPRAPGAPPPRPRARMAERDERDARDALHAIRTPDALAAGDALSHRRDALPLPVFRRLRRGEIAAQDELDLHGADVRQAETLLRAFVAHAHREGLGCVRVIHGKGLHGDGPFGATGLPVLKNMVDRVLRQRADVLAFHSAPPAQGGTGAVLVLLSPPRRR